MSEAKGQNPSRTDVNISASELEWLKDRKRELEEEVLDLAWENDRLRCALRVDPENPDSEIAKLRAKLPHFEWIPESYIWDMARAEKHGVIVYVYRDGNTWQRRSTVEWAGKKRNFLGSDRAIDFALDLIPLDDDMEGRNE